MNNYKTLPKFDYKGDNELFAETNKELIGKRAKFKDKLQGYTEDCWNRKGTITTSEHTPWLYLKFDKPIKKGLGGSMITRMLIIVKDSIELLTKKGGYYYCPSCFNITFHDNKGACENTEVFKGKKPVRRFPG
jgi:hypothetical protein